MSIQVKLPGYKMTLAEIADIECIVRRAIAGRDLALNKKDSTQVDNYEQLLVYAQALLPISNRFRREKMSTTEEMIQAKGLTAPRITPEHIDTIIADIEYHKLTDVLTVCVITTRNGFTVTGESACASPENYDEEIGNHIAYKMAEGKVWGLEGYLLKEQLHLKELEDIENADFDDDIPF